MKSRHDRAMEEHEKNLLRQFRSNIIEVEDCLQKEQSKEEDVAGVPRAWIERTAQLSRDVDRHKESAMRLDRINDVLNQKVEKYKHECKIQEDDREFWCANSWPSRRKTPDCGGRLRKFRRVSNWKRLRHRQPPDRAVGLNRFALMSTGHVPRPCRLWETPRPRLEEQS